MASIRNDIIQRWRSVLGDDLLEETDAGRFHEFVTQIRAQQEVEAEKLLDPWLPIFDAGIEWIASDFGSIDQAQIAGATGFDDSRSAVAFLGAACANAVAIRHLVTAGLDSPARVVLRTMVESLHFAIACLQSDEIAAGIRSPVDHESIHGFWKRNLRPENLAEILSAAEASVGLDSAAQSFLRKQRAAVRRLLGQIVHPSYSSAESSARTTLASDPSQFGVALIGRCSQSSIVTLDFANKALWHFCQVGVPIMERRGYFARVDRQCEMTVIAVAGRRVFTQLVSDHWEDADVE